MESDAVFSLHSRIFGLDEPTMELHDEVWAKWLGVGQVTQHRLLDLVKDDQIAPAFRARALTVLMVPRLDMCPFKAPNDVLLRVFPMHSYHGQVLDGFVPPPLLAPYAYRLLHLCMVVAEQAREQDVRKSLDTYRSMAIAALETMSEDSPMASLLFHAWHPLDPVISTDSPGLPPGYGGLLRLWRSAVPEWWKSMADARMVDIVRAEVLGEATPRVEWEYAAAQYAWLVAEVAESPELPYGQGNQDLCMQPAGRGGLLSLGR